MLMTQFPYRPRGSVPFSIDELSSRPAWPAFQLFTRRQHLQDALYLGEKLLIIITESERHDHLVRGCEPYRAAIGVSRCLQFLRLQRGLWMKLDFELVPFKQCAHDHHFAHLAPQIHRGDQILDQSRDRPEAIAHLVADLAEIVEGSGARHPPIQHQPFVFISDEAVRDVSW